MARFGAHDLDLDSGVQRRHRPQRVQNRGKERERSADRHPGRQRHFQQLLVVRRADDQAPDVTLDDQFLGAVYEFAAGHQAMNETESEGHVGEGVHDRLRPPIGYPQNI
jgi:hypothetical protein